MLFHDNSPNTVLIGLVIGVSLLLYGVRLISDALQRVISGRMQQAVIGLSKRPLSAFGIGIVGTAILQSSSATASLLVELVSAGLVPLSVAIVMMMGANVGSTLVVQLLALHITDYAFELLGLGVVVALLTHRSTIFRRPGQALFAFGLIVLGLAAIGVASQPLVENKGIKDALQALADAPIVLVVMGTGLAILLNSSVASIGLVLTLAAKGALPPVAALAIMLGANLGTTALALLSALSQGTLSGRRLALVHSGTKLLGVILLLLLIEPLAALLQQIWPGDPGTQVALTHMGFNLALAVVFVPLSAPLAHLMERLLPEKRYQTEEVPLSNVLDMRALATPEVAQGLATRETVRMADIVTHMFELSIRAFEEQSEAIKGRIKAMDDQVDELNTAIKGYLTQLDEEAMTEQERHQDIILLTVTSDLEAIGDVITHSFMGLARRKSRDQILFSEEGWEDLLNYHQQIQVGLQHVVAALATRNPMLATKYLARKEELKQTKRNLHLRHIRQLRANIPNSTPSSAIYLDLLDAMSTVRAHISNIAHTLEGINYPQYTCALQDPHTEHLAQTGMSNTQQWQNASQANLAHISQW